MFNGKNIVVGVCGGIAAYKTAGLVRYLKKNKAEVDVIMTENSLNFITPLTMQTLSNNPVTTDMFRETVDWDIKHISLAQKADLIIVAPATANIIGKVASGIADDMLSTVIMAAECKVMFVPAMNTKMYENRIVQENIKKLKHLGYLFVEPDEGELACGDTGSGRFPEMIKITDALEETLEISKDSVLSGRKIIITAGPTREYFDAVRYFTNPSSGKMGYALAEQAEKRGMEVTLVTGPVEIDAPSSIKLIPVESAEEMYEAVNSEYEKNDIAIFTAAVADYRPADKIEGKYKKGSESLEMKMIMNPDIAYEMSGKKGSRINVGFSAESEDLIKNAAAKLKKKNFDLIIANDITKKDAGFGTDTNKITIINRDGKEIKSSSGLKKELAKEILDEIENIIGKQRRTGNGK